PCRYRVAGRGLRASQAVFYPVIDRTQSDNSLGGQVAQLSLGDAADAACGAQPQRFSIIYKIGDVIAQKPVLGGEMSESSISECVQPPTECRNPKCSVLIFEQGTDLIARKSIFSRQPTPVLAAKPEQARLVGSGPQGPIL